MFDRMLLIGLVTAGLSVMGTSIRCSAGVPNVTGGHLILLADGGDKNKAGEKEDADDEKDGDKKDERHERKEEKEIEQAVPMNMVPQPILDAVKKELPNGTITEAELEAKKGKILYSFDVKDGEMAYDVKITVDGKFFSKKVDDEKDEHEDDEKGKKPASAEKK